MNSIERNDAGLADFLAGWHARVEGWKGGIVTGAVIGLTNFGEYPVQSTRLAELLDLPVREAEALARQWGWPGTRVDSGHITVDPERAKAAARRQVRIGKRQFGVTGCALDVFFYAPLVHPSLHLEETCPTTGAPIRIEFIPDQVEHVDPAGTVLPMGAPQMLDQAEGMHIEDIDANLCEQAPFLSSADAARGWLADNPGGRVFPIREAWDLSPIRISRDRIPALLSLDN